MQNNDQSSKPSAYNLNAVAKNLSNIGAKRLTIIKSGTPYNTGNVTRANSSSAKKK